MIRNNNKPHRQTEANQVRTQRVIETYHGKVDLLRTWKAQPAGVLIRNHADIILPVPVLAKAAADNRESSRQETPAHSGEARESQVHVTDAAAVSDFRGGQNKCSGVNKGRASGSLLGCFKLPFASPDFMLDR